MSYKPVVLVIMDGVGIAPDNAGNAFALAAKPNLEKISRSHPGTALHASSMAVGLPWGEFGSSEVGHTNIGAGFVIYQNYPRISLAIQNKSFFKMPVWQEAMVHAKKNNSDIHLMGLLTNVGIHAHIDHLNALIETFKKFKRRVFLHLFTDGEDSPPRSAVKLLEKLEGAQIATVIGRNYAMDRNNRTEFTNAAYECLVKNTGEKAASAEEVVQNAYNKNLGDEAIVPTTITDKNGQPLAAIKEKDVLIFFNFRSDRVRQLAELFLPWKDLFFVTLTQYKDDWSARVAFPRQQIANPLSKVLSDNQRTQLKIAESE
ncbi:MAG: 2,3-bisphosphoglycerate-independent phosphoglycerate mutase, partial [Patescibacteria group bacterium]